MKYFFLDVETTGVNPEKNGLIQVSGCIQIQDQVLESFDYFVRPYSSDLIEEGALQVTGIDRRQLLHPEDPNFFAIPDQEFLSPQKVYSLLNTLLERYVDKFDRTDKYHLIGYNAHSFDMPFLRRFWEKNNDRYLGSWFWYPCLDVMLIWAQILEDKRQELSNFKLATVAQYAGIEVDETRLHDSQYDIELTRNLWLRAKEIFEPRSRDLAPGEQGSLFD